MVDSYLHGQRMACQVSVCQDVEDHVEDPRVALDHQAHHCCHHVDCRLELKVVDAYPDLDPLEHPDVDLLEDSH